MYKKEWDVIQKELSKYLPKGVSLRYDGIISTKFPEIRPIGAPETYYTDPDYDKGAVLSVAVGPFDIHDQVKMNLCIERMMMVLAELKYEVDRRPHGFINYEGNTWYIWFKKPHTELYLTDEED